MRTDKEITAHWEKTANALLEGKKILAVRYMTDDEREQLGWYCRSVCILLDDGTWIYPSRDDEGNDGGALFTSNESVPILPVI
jgi:hypothetical protein